MSPESFSSYGLTGFPSGWNVSAQRNCHPEILEGDGDFGSRDSQKEVRPLGIDHSMVLETLAPSCLPLCSLAVI